MKWKFIYDIKKDEKLKAERNIGFKDVISAIETGRILEVRDHHNLQKYPDQKFFIIEINNYAYLVPYLIDGDVTVLKTVYPCRKATKFHLRCSEETEGEHNVG